MPHTITTETQIIAITGGSGSGKTTAAKMLQTLIGNDCKILSQDNYYKDQSMDFKGDGSINFDHPDAIDFSLMATHLLRLKEGKSIHIPIYDFVTHTRKTESRLFTPTKFIIIDGTLVLFKEHLRRLFNYSLFLDIPENIRFSRRLKRDVEERGRTSEGVHIQFYNLVKPMHDLYISPLSIYGTYIARDDLQIKESVEQLCHALKNQG